MVGEFRRLRNACEIEDVPPIGEAIAAIEQPVTRFRGFVLGYGVIDVNVDRFRFTGEEIPLNWGQ